MGTISGQGAGKVPPNNELENLFKNLIGEANPARKLELSQLTEALQTGGVGARIPIIQRAVEAAMGANQQSETLGRQQTARAGLSGTPFDIASQLGTRTQDSAQVAGIGPAIASQLIGQGPELTSSTYNTALGANQQFQGVEEFNSNQIGRFYEDLKQSLEFTGSAAAGGGGAGAGGGSSASTPTYASIGYGDPSTFNPQGAQFQE